MGPKGMPTGAQLTWERPRLTGPETALRKNRFCCPAQHGPVLLRLAEGKEQSQPTGSNPRARDSNGETPVCFQ